MKGDSDRFGEQMKAFSEFNLENIFRELHGHNDDLERIIALFLKARFKQVGKQEGAWEQFYEKI